MMNITCCICGNVHQDADKELFTVNNQKLVTCSGCGVSFFPQFNEYDYGEYDITSYENDPALFYYYHNLLADIILRYKKKGSLLDIGSGVGILVDIMRKKGWDAEGIESSKQGVDYAKKKLNISLIRKDFLKLKINKKYDVVTANHVIEHVSDPNLFLKKIKSLLNDKGFILLGLPNIACLEFKIFGKKWPSLVSDQHIWHFNPKTITKLFEKNGMEVVKIIIEQPKRKFSTFPKKIVGHALYEPFRLFTTILGIGSNMFVVGVKHDKK